MRDGSIVSDRTSGSVVTGMLLLLPVPPSLLLPPLRLATVRSQLSRNRMQQLLVDGRIQPSMSFSFSAGLLLAAVAPLRVVRHILHLID